MDNRVYESPFSSRYASREMQYIFSADKKFTTWRRLWVALARSEMELGLPVSGEQVLELESQIGNIDYVAAAAREREVRHDVMAHVYAYGLVCPKARGIIHLGATSCYVCDNTDVIIMKEGLELIRGKLLTVIKQLGDFAFEYKGVPCLGYTHLQPAQLTTVGKRATLWINELLMDLEELDFRIDGMKLLGSKGTTGTQASFLELFEGDHEKVRALEGLIAKEMGFGSEAKGWLDGVVPVSGQTYSRKLDAQISATLSGIAQSASKFSYDLRLLQNFKEVEEPFEAHQIGSSAMPYKRNPMRSERISSLARYVMTDALSPAFTAGTQWLERTLDDSANKRIAVAEAFLGVDSILNLLINVTNGLVVRKRMIHSRVMSELPFMASENMLMRAVKKGGDRQELHERLREYAIAAGNRVKEEGLPNDLCERVAEDSAFGLSSEELEFLLRPELYIGRAEVQTEEFLNEVVRPALETHTFESTVAEIEC